MKHIIRQCTLSDLVDGDMFVFENVHTARWYVKVPMPAGYEAQVASGVVFVNSIRDDTTEAYSGVNRVYQVGTPGDYMILLLSRDA